MVSKQISSDLRNTLFIVSETCIGELIHSKWGCASFMFYFSDQFWNTRKTMKYPYLHLKKSVFMKYKCILEFQTGFAYPFNAALNWVYVHFQWQGTMEEISSHIWTNVIREILMHLPNYPSTANTFFRKGPQEAPHPWSPINCNGMGCMSNWPQNEKAVQKPAFCYRTSLVVHLRASHSYKFSTEQQISKWNLYIN